MLVQRNLWQCIFKVFYIKINLFLNFNIKRVAVHWVFLLSCIQILLIHFSLFHTESKYIKANRFSVKVYYTLKEHQMVRTFAIFQKFLISMEVYAMSKFLPSK